MNNDLLEFIEQSNFIENERTSQAFDDAVAAWKYLDGCMNLTEPCIKAAHRILMRTRNIDDKYKGNYRDCNVRVGRRVCPIWEDVPLLMAKYMVYASKELAPFINAHTSLKDACEV